MMMSSYLDSTEYIAGRHMEKQLQNTYLLLRLLHFLIAFGCVNFFPFTNTLVDGFSRGN